MGNSLTGQKLFGGGYFWGRPNTTNPTPVRFGTVQSVSLDFKREIKYLYGSDGQAAQDVAAGKLTVSGKTESGSLNGRAVNSLLLGGTLSDGETVFVRNEAGSIPAATAYTIEVDGADDFLEDLGVILTTSGANTRMVRVASAPAEGQYSVDESTGTYTFAAANASGKVLIDYTKTDDSAGQSIDMANQPMGKIGGFTATLGMIYGAEKSLFQLNNTIGGGFSLATKLDDYAMPSMDFGCAVDDNGTLGTLSFAQVS
jgi:hypothetical protein